MTSKQALNQLRKQFEMIEKDLKNLEVLDILKSKKYIPLGKLNPKHWLNKDVYNEVVTYKYYLRLCEEECEYFISDGEKLTKKEFIKIMRWLNNDK